jgi:hypothetical protein
MNFDGDQPMRIGVGERLQQDAVNDAEYRGGGADSEGQRGHSEKSKCAIPPKAPSRGTNIAPQEGHAGNTV